MSSSSSCQTYFAPFRLLVSSVIILLVIESYLLRNINLQQTKFGGLQANKSQYFELSLEKEDIKTDALAFKVNGIRKFTDPDVIIAVDQQKRQFNITTNALKRCQSWGQDVCILQNQQIIEKNVKKVNIAVFCQFQCDFSIVVKRLPIETCQDKPNEDTVLTPQEELISQKCLVTFDDAVDIRAIQFYVPSLQQYDNGKNIKHLTFLAHNMMNMGKNTPKIDVWVQQGKKIPQSDCSCKRGYTLFQRSIGTRVSGDKIKLGHYYTMLIQEIVPNSAQLEDIRFSVVEMLVQLDKHVVDIRSDYTLFPLKQGIVDEKEESCFKYFISRADSDMLVTLQVHTGFGTLYIGTGDPVFENQQYKKDAYFQNESQNQSFQQISPYERHHKGQTGYQYLCFYGIKASTFTIKAREQPHNVKIGMINQNETYEFEILRNNDGEGKKDLMFVSQDVKKVEDLIFILRSRGELKIDMFIKKCDLVIDRNADPKQSFTVTSDENGRVFSDFSMFQEKCKPTKNEIEGARMGRTENQAVMAQYLNSKSNYVKIIQECQGEMVLTKGAQIKVNACGYWIHLVNMQQNPQRARLQTTMFSDDYEMVLKEQKIETLQLKRQFELYLSFSVSDTSAKEIRIEIDSIHGDTDMFVSKWKKPTIKDSMFKSTRCGRIPDVITITKVKLKQFYNQDSDSGQNNLLVGQYYILIRALQDSTFNIVYSVKSAQRGQDDSDVTLSSVIRLDANKPFSATLSTSHMLFIFNGDFELQNGEDLKVSVSNIDTNQVLDIFVTPWAQSEYPPAKIEDYKFRNTILHPNYVVIKQSDDVNLAGSFYIRVQRNKYNIEHQKNGVKFRINVKFGNQELNLRNGQSQQGIIMPNDENIGSFFSYYQLDPENDVNINLNRISGDSIKMFVGIGVKYPSAEGPRIMSVDGQTLKLDKQKIESLSRNCKSAIDERTIYLYDADQKITKECSIHIGVFPKVLSSSLSKEIVFSIKATEENTIKLSVLIDGKSQKGFFKQDQIEPLQPQYHTYSYKLPQFPHNGLLVTALSQRSNLIFLAQIIPIDDENSFSLSMLYQRRPKFLDQQSYSFQSIDFARHHYLKINSNSLKNKECDSKQCYVLITVYAVTSEFDLNYQILVASKVQNLPDQSIVYGDVSPGNYSYFVYHNTCEKCTVRFFLNTISPGSGDADIFVNYSLQQKLQKLPTKKDANFGDQTYKQDTLIIDNDKMKGILQDGELLTMAGYYMIGVYGGDKKESQVSIQPMIHFSLRVSTSLSNYILLDEGINHGIKDAQKDQIRYFLWQNWGAAHFNVYVTPTIGDVDIWVNTYQGEVKNDMEKYFPRTKQQATWSTNKKGTRNKLQLSLSQDNNEEEKKKFCVYNCYFIIGVKNKLKTDYEIFVDTLAGHDTDSEPTKPDDVFLPLNMIKAQTCWVNKRVVYTVPIHNGGQSTDKVYLKIAKSINIQKSLLYDIGTKRFGNELKNDGFDDYLQIDLAKSDKLGEYYNIYITLTCYDQIEFSIQVKKDWKIPIQITTNQPIPSKIYKGTKPDLYSFKYTQEIPALQVSLLKRSQCKIDLLLQIYPDDVFGLQQYHVPTYDSAAEILKSEDQKNYQLLQTSIDMSKISINSQIVFQVLYSQSEKEAQCPYTLQLDAGAVVKMLIEDVFYQSSIRENVKSQDQYIKDKMRIFEIANPHYKMDDFDSLMLHVQVKPCAESFIGIYVSHVYVDQILKVQANAQNYTRDMVKGRLTLHIKANMPQYYIYVFKIDTQLQQRPAYFFVRAFYGEKHKEYQLAQNGKIEIAPQNKDQKKNQDAKKGVTIKWGSVYRMKSLAIAQAVEKVKFVVKGQKGMKSLQTQCEMRGSDAFVIAYLQNVYELFINFEQQYFNDVDGITINVEAIPIQQWTESILYEELYLQKNYEKTSTLWVYLTIVFGGLAIFSVVLAIIFKKNLKKTQKQLQFEMTDVRNVARVNAPAAAPYYNVEEEEDTDQKSAILKSSENEEKI